jgi:uracil phosphoribosyltransferase
MKESLLTILRDEKTSVGQFRQAAQQLADLIAAEATSFVEEMPKAIKTPLAKTEGMSVHQRSVLVPILRAGLILVPSFLNYFPDAPIGVFGIRRDEATAAPQLYYENLPLLKSTDLVFLLDPMIATGGSALLALQHLIDKGITKIVLVGILGSKEGVERIKKQHPDVEILIAAKDPDLNSRKFILPGLGDFGDRYFGC